MDGNSIVKYSSFLEKNVSHLLGKNLFYEKRFRKYPNLKYN